MAGGRSSSIQRGWRRRCWPDEPTSRNDVMPQKPRPDESRAADVVSRALGIDLEFSDTAGGVDYRSPDGVVALEVTRLTRSGLRRDMAVAGQSDHVVDLGTGYDW